MSDAYPLKWPTGWPRAKSRQRAVFGKMKASGYGYDLKGQVSVIDAQSRLAGEIDRLGAKYAVLSSNMERRLDGAIRGGQSEPFDPGVALYFELGGKAMTLACDKWDRVADNIVAIAKHIEALRGMDRWGVGTAAQAFAGYEALPAPKPWWQVLGLSGPTSDRKAIADAYRRAAALAHPDRPGGSHDAMAALNAARDEGLDQ